MKGFFLGAFFVTKFCDLIYCTCVGIRYRSESEASLASYGFNKQFGEFFGRVILLIIELVFLKNGAPT